MSTRQGWAGWGKGGFCIQGPDQIKPVFWVGSYCDPQLLLPLFSFYPFGQMRSWRLIGLGAGRFHLDKETSLWELNALLWDLNLLIHGTVEWRLGGPLWGGEGCRLGRGQLTFQGKG